MSEKLSYSGRTSSYLHKWHPDQPNSADENPGLRKVWFLDAQWSTCPIEVENEVKVLWSYNELGNDRYILKTSVNGLLDYIVDGATSEVWNPELVEYEEKPIKVDYLVQYIREHGIPDDEQVIIHWWW